MSGGVHRSTLQLFRDCLRLAKHIAPGESAKGVALRAMVNTEFRKNKDEEDESKLELQKSAAVRALANYMLYESGTKDAKLGKAMKKYHDTSINSANKAKEEGLNTKNNVTNNTEDGGKQ